MDTSKIAWELLSKMTGAYKGRGMNHEKQPFTGEFTLQEAIPGKLLTLTSSATGDEGEVYHAEHAWIGADLFGTLNLYVASNNHPGVTVHGFHRLEEGPEGDRAVVFRFGDPAKADSFREEVVFTIHADGSLTHFYFWGLPGGTFEPRSGSRMAKRV